MKRSIFAAIIALALTGAAQADEIWTSEEGDIVYESEIEAGQMAVFKAPGMRMYISGLAGVFTDRGTYPGVWIMDAVPEGVEGCSVEIVRPGTDDETTAFWGQLEITFIDPDFPGTWIANMVQCFDGPGENLIGRPVTALDGE